MSGCNDSGPARGFFSGLESGFGFIQWGGLSDEPIASSSTTLGLFVAEAFPFRFAQAGVHAVAVFVFAHVPAKVELGKVAVQMLLADVVEGAIDATLDEGEGAFHGVCGDLCPVTRIAAGILMTAMVHRAVRVFVFQVLVGSEFIRVNACAKLHVFHHGSAEVLGGDFINDHGALVATTFHEGEHGGFVGPASFPAFTANLATDVGFIDFNDAAQGRPIKDAVSHGVTNAMSKMPCALILLESKVALQLEGADAFLAGAHEMKGHEPFTQADVRAVEDRSNGHSERFAALGALVESGAGAFALHGKGTLRTAMWASAPSRPADTFEVFAGLIFIQTSGFCEIHAQIVVQNVGMSNA